MSQAALCLAARDKLREALTLTADNCRVTPSGQPPAFAGELFLAVWPNGSRADDVDNGLSERCTFTVTVTRRATYSPQDQAGEEVWAKASAGLEAVAEEVRAQLHLAWDVLAAANGLIGPSANGFVEPPRFRSLSAPRPVRADWFSARETGRSEAYSGLVVDVQFDSARRVQRRKGPQT